jgi:hypothetical protein
MIRYFFSTTSPVFAVASVAMTLPANASPANASGLDEMISHTAVPPSFDLASLPNRSVHDDDSWLDDDFAAAANAPAQRTEEPAPIEEALAQRDVTHTSTTLPTYGPVDDHDSAPSFDRERFRTFGSQVGAVKWEMATILGYYTAINGVKLSEDPTWPHFHSEGFFGVNTNNVGIDKLAHAYSAYILSELLHSRLRRKTDEAPGIQYTAAALASATMLYTEFWDSIEKTSGWSWEDVTFNTLGSGFSVLRNSVPGLDRKLDYRLMVVPNSSIFNAEGKRHFEQQRYFFALKLSGFKAFERGPLRLLEIHLGYSGEDFSNADRARGIRPKRHVFAGVGINLRQLFFRDPESRLGRAVGDTLDYFSPPYTSISTDLTN